VPTPFAERRRVGSLPKVPDTRARTFGELLRRHRLVAGLAQETLAERARLSVETIGALERGVRQKPYLETIGLLVEALGLSAGDRAELERAAARRAPSPANGGDAVAASGLAGNNLPVARTTFVGRQRELAKVEELLARHWLLTLVGSGGVGKTRLAIQAGAKLLDRYHDGVWFIDFAPIGDPALVPSVVAKALGMSQSQGGSIDEPVSQWLKRKKLLLIFDNCEHVLDPVAALADAILASAHEVRILATSRQRLGVGGEAVYRLPSLAVPSEAAELKVSEALNYGAVALFVERATAADTRFTLTDDNASNVAEICRRLDGIALAIELAAARVTVLTIPTLARRLNERFTLLTGGSRSALPRQKTLTALIDWSYGLLSSSEQRLFGRLGIFAGGFGLDAVTAVCGDGLDEVDLLDLLGSLTDQSLVVADTGGTQERYRLLESTAAYALDKLSASGARERLARRHAEYFRRQAEAADQRFGSGSTIAWLAGVEAELDNFRAALGWALTRGNDACLGGAIAGALERLWWDAGLSVEGRYWIELALAHVSQTQHPAIAARLQLALSVLFVGKRKHDAAQRAMRLYESVGDFRGAARAERQRASGLSHVGRLDEARATGARALASSRACEDSWGVAHCLNQLGLIEMSRADFSAGRDLLEQALAGMKALGDDLGTSRGLGNLAELEFADGEPEKALRLANETLELASIGRNLIHTAPWHLNACAYRIALGDFAGARRSAHEGLRLARRARRRQLIPIALQHLALLAVLGGDARSAARLLGYVNAQYDDLQMKRESTEQWGYDRLQRALREKCGEDDIKRLAAEGAAWSEDRAVEEALTA
jgi:predicted ATPase/DNA-binding XRE family transcriptional regulator